MYIFYSKKYKLSEIVIFFRISLFFLKTNCRFSRKLVKSSKKGVTFIYRKT